MTLLAVDPSTTSVGWAEFSLTGDLLHVDVLRPRGADLDLRLFDLQRQWNRLWFVGGPFQQVTHFIQEAGFKSNSQDISDALAVARHYLRLPAKLRQRPAPVRILPPVQNSTWKKVVLGHGSAKKPTILAYVQERWSLDTESQDAADAVCIGMYGLQQLAKTAKTAAQKELV